MSHNDELPQQHAFARDRLDPDQGFAQLKSLIDRLTNDGPESERVDRLLEDVEAIDAAYRAGSAAHSDGNLEVAVRELRRAALGGHPEAASDLAMLLLREAATWLLEAVSAGAVAPEDLDVDLQQLWWIAPKLTAHNDRQPAEALTRASSPGSELPRPAPPAPDHDHPARSTPVAHRIASPDRRAISVGVQLVEEVPVDRLRFGLSPRQVPCDDQHVAALAAVLDDVPPIVVHAPTLQVIDGVHRAHAAKALGRRTIRALIFEGDETQAYIEAVRSNVAHGKPLSLHEREAAAQRVLQLVPTWSDRRIATVSGLSPKTVARLRERATADSALRRARQGSDGRLRPVDQIAVRQRVAEALRADPEASNRAIARRTGASQATVRDVRTRLSQGLSEYVSLADRRLQRRATRRSSAAAPMSTVPFSATPGMDEPSAPSPGQVGLPTNPPGVPPAQSGGVDGIPAELVIWLDEHSIGDDHWQHLVDVVPINRVYEIADACRKASASWKAFAGALMGRARAARRDTKAG